MYNFRIRNMSKIFSFFKKNYKEYKVIRENSEKQNKEPKFPLVLSHKDCCRTTLAHLLLFFFSCVFFRVSVVTWH